MGVEVEVTVPTFLVGDGDRGDCSYISGGGGNWRREPGLERRVPRPGLCCTSLGLREAL